MKLKVSLSVCSHTSLSGFLSACQSKQKREMEHEKERLMKQQPVKLGRHDSDINSYDLQHTFPT